MVLYDVGDVARLTATFTNDLGVPVAPTTVTLRILRPSGTTTTVATTITAVGSYRADVPLDQAGVWRYRWVSTGVASAAEESSFRVKTPTVT